MNLNEKNKWQNGLTIVLAGACIVFLVHIGSSVGKQAKIDFTEDNLYSLGDGTKGILGKLSSPVRLKLFYSKTAAKKGTEGIRAFNNYFEYVRNILEEYVSASGNNLSLEVIDPRPDTRDEEDAMAFGIKRFLLTETEAYFFGLVAIGSTGSQKIIEFFSPERQQNLEYELTKLIYSATSPEKQSIGILSSLNFYNEDLSPYMARIMKLQGKRPETSWVIAEKNEGILFSSKDSRRN